MHFLKECSEMITIHIFGQGLSSHNIEFSKETTDSWEEHKEPAMSNAEVAL